MKKMNILTKKYEILLVLCELSNEIGKLASLCGGEELTKEGHKSMANSFNRISSLVDRIGYKIDYLFHIL